MKCMMGPGYKAMLGAHAQNDMKISHKVEKGGKPCGKNPPPKREMERKRGKTSWEKPSPKKRDEKGYMDGWSNQAPPL